MPSSRSAIRFRRSFARRICAQRLEPGRRHSDLLDPSFLRHPFTVEDALPEAIILGIPPARAIFFPRFLDYARNAVHDGGITSLCGMPYAKLDDIARAYVLSFGYIKEQRIAHFRAEFLGNASTAEDSRSDDRSVDDIGIVDPRRLYRFVKQFHLENLVALGGCDNLTEVQSTGRHVVLVSSRLLSEACPSDCERADEEADWIGLQQGRGGTTRQTHGASRWL